MDIDVMVRDIANLKRQAAEHVELQKKLDELLRFKASTESTLERSVMKSHEDGIHEARFADHDARIGALEAALSKRGGSDKGSR